MCTRSLKRYAPSRTHRALIVVRCGDVSLHPEYVNQDSDFDVVLSYFGHKLTYELTHVQYVHECKGSKWEGLHAFFSNYPEIWQQYDYIWLPDDDVRIDVTQVNRFLAICVQQGFDLAQPALTHDSYYSFLITLQVKGLLCRTGNFVEIMAPLFSHRAFGCCVDSFSENKSGFGLEFLWRARLTRLKGHKVGLIDATPMVHTRPVGSAGNGMGTVDTHQLTPRQERKRLFKKYHLFAKNKKCTAAITMQGEVIADPKVLRQLIYQGLPKKYTTQPHSQKKIYKMVCAPKHLKWIFW